MASEPFTSTSAPIQYAAVTAFSQNNEIDIYLIHVRRILSALAKYLTTKLHEMKVDIAVPHGASMEIGIGNELSESFIREFCPRMVKAFDRLGNWFSEL